jgi:predicted nucleic acid-binding protein
MNDGPPLYLDTSVVLRAALEAGLTPELEDRLEAAAPLLLTSRLSLVEAARAFHRIRIGTRVEEDQLGQAIRGVEALWARCEIWKLTPRVCERASLLRPELPLRNLDALHLATYLLARERIEGLELLTADRRLEAAAAGL